MTTNNERQADGVCLKNSDGTLDPYSFCCGPERSFEMYGREELTSRASVMHTTVEQLKSDGVRVVRVRLVEVEPPQ